MGRFRKTANFQDMIQKAYKERNRIEEILRLPTFDGVDEEWEKYLNDE